MMFCSLRYPKVQNKCLYALIISIYPRVTNRNSCYYLENQLPVLRVLLRNKQDKCHTQDVILFANICSILMCSNGFTKAIEILLN